MGLHESMALQLQGTIPNGYLIFDSFAPLMLNFYIKKNKNILLRVKMMRILDLPGIPVSRLKDPPQFVDLSLPPVDPFVSYSSLFSKKQENVVQ